MKKEILYNKTDFTDDDGIKLANLEAEFMDLKGWEAESEAQTLLNSIGVSQDFHHELAIDSKNKSKQHFLTSLILDNQQP